jgi:anti-anti-sigma factor
MTPEQASRRRLWRLHTKTSVEQGTTVLFLEGRLGHAAAAELANLAGQPRLDASGMIIDLSGVDYLSSAALKVFQSLADGQSLAGGRLTLRAPSVAARLALELSGLLELVDPAHPEDVGAADEPPQTQEH